MGDPVTMAMIGAGVGAVTNRRNPLQGALIGGALGGVGGSFAGGVQAAGQNAANLAAQYGADSLVAQQALPTLGERAVSGLSALKGDIGALGTFAKENPYAAGMALQTSKSALFPEQAPPPPSAGLLRGSQIAQPEQMQMAMQQPRISLI